MLYGCQRLIGSVSLRSVRMYALVKLGVRDYPAPQRITSLAGRTTRPPQAMSAVKPASQSATRLGTEGAANSTNSRKHTTSRRSAKL